MQKYHRTRGSRRLFAALTSSLLLLGAACEETPEQIAGDGNVIKDTGPGKDGGPIDGQPPPKDTGPSPDGQLKPVPWGYFPEGAVWYRDYSSAKVHADSDAIIAELASAGGWGGGGTMRIDFSLHVLEADGSPLREFTPTDNHFSPDCDTDKVPVPAEGALEGEDGYECTGDGDCHLIVADRQNFKLYEMWVANINGGSFEGGCLAVWDMTRIYGPEGRGAQCTSADAAGFPIAPLLFTADEVKAGEIKHAIRFILPNSRIRRKKYVAPATHSTNATQGGDNAPPYGVHFRLKASFDESKLKPGARVVARAMKKYGMFLADGGQIALTAQNDRFTTAKWDGLLESRDLDSIKVEDFEVIDHGPVIDYTADCQR